MLEKNIAYLLDTVISKARYNEQTGEYQIKEEDYVYLGLSNKQLELLKLMCKISGIKLEYTDKPLPSIEDDELFRAYNDIQLKIASNLDSEELKKLEQRRIELRNKIFLDNMELVRTIINKEMDGIHDMKDKEDIYQLGYEVLLEFIDSHNITTKGIFTTYISKYLMGYINKKLAILNPDTDQITTHEQSRLSINSPSITSLSDDTLEEYIFYKMQQDYIMKIIDTLSTENQRLVIILFFGLNGETEHTIEEIAKVTRTTTKNISPILQNALNNLQHSIRSKYLYQYALDQNLNKPINPLEEISDLKRGAFEQLELFLIKKLKQEELLEILNTLNSMFKDVLLVYFGLIEEINNGSDERLKQIVANPRKYIYNFAYSYRRENGLAILRKRLKMKYVDNNPNENITNYFDYLMHNYLTKRRKKH